MLKVIKVKSRMSEFWQDTVVTFLGRSVRDTQWMCDFYCPLYLLLMSYSIKFNLISATHRVLCLSEQRCHARMHYLDTLCCS